MATRVANPESEYSTPMGSDDDQSYVPSAQEEDSDGDSIMTDPKTKKPDTVNLLNETGCLPSGGGGGGVRGKKKRSKKHKRGDPFKLKPSKGELAKQQKTNVLYFQADEDFHASNQGQRKKLELFALRVRLFTPGGREIEPEELRNRVVVCNYNTGLRTRSFNPAKLDFDVWNYEKQGPAIKFCINDSSFVKITRGQRLGSAALLNPIYVPNQPEDEVGDEEVEPYRGASRC